MAAAPNHDQPALRLVLYQDELTVNRLPADTPIPPRLLEQKWFTISRTLDEVSIIVPTASNFLGNLMHYYPDMRQEDGWRCMKIDSVLDFSLVGILASIVNPLKDVGIPVFVVSTFDTDYILMNKACVENAAKVITEQTNYEIVESDLSLC